MNFLIDGHNLIGSNLFSDIRLSDEDDEAKLVMRLKIWQSRVRGTIAVIFDRGIPGGLDIRMGSAGVQVIFAANPAQADDLIKRRLRKAQPGLILVTNDEALLHEAAVHRVTAWRGADFVERMKLKMPERAEAGTEVDVQVSKAEVEEWLSIFRAHAEMKKLLRKRAKADGAAAAPGKAPTKPSGTPLGKPANKALGNSLGKPSSQSANKPLGDGVEKSPEKSSPKSPAQPPAQPSARPPTILPTKPPTKPVGKVRKESGKGRKKK